nr:hypothetical protein [Tanacetum cinerariifolium]
MKPNRYENKDGCSYRNMMVAAATVGVGRWRLGQRRAFGVYMMAGWRRMTPGGILELQFKLNVSYSDVLGCVDCYLGSKLGN